VKHVALTAALSVVFVGLALASGRTHRAGAAVGAAISAVTALTSILVMARVARSGAKPLQGALAVMTGAFLVRLVLLGVGTILVARAGASILGFVVAFFVPYFVFAAVEGAYVHSLRRSGTAA
jgi:hypothetical protein